MKGYKAFNADLTCRGFQFVEGETHVQDGIAILCEYGFHFCTDLQDVVKYYHDPKMRVFEIEASGNITDAEDVCSKRACTEIRLVKELSLYEVRDSINNELSAIRWALNIGDKERMKQFITESRYAYSWAKNIGDKEYMRQFITDTHHAYWWVENVNKDDEQYFIDKGLMTFIHPLV